MGSTKGPTDSLTFAAHIYDRSVGEICSYMLFHSVLVHVLRI